MKKIVFISLAFLLMLGSAIAQKKVRKVGYVDLEFVFKNSASKQNLYIEYKKQRRRILRAKSNAEDNLTRLKLETRKLESILGYDEYKKRSAKIKLKIKEYETSIQEARTELEKWEADLMGSAFDDIIRVLEIIALENDLSLIVSKKNAILYGDPNLDFTQDAIDLINEVNERNTPSAK